MYSPKLKKAMDEIKGILHKHDIAGMVILHTPGYGEYLFELSPSYSRLKVDEKLGTIRFKAKLQEDFGGDRVAQVKAMTETLNMLQTITETGAPMFMSVMNMTDIANKALNADDTPGDHSSQISQDN